MRINHNIAALNTHRQLGQANNAQQNSMEKLSSGLRINNASDDAAGLAISEKMRGQIRGLEQSQRNAQDATSLIQTAEGALNETHDILQRMRELATQSANDTNTTEDRAEIQKEVDQLSEEITRISDNTEFNTQNLLDGSFKGTFHIGANEGQNIGIAINNMGANSLGVEGAEGVKMTVSSASSISSINADGAATNTDAAEAFGALGDASGANDPSATFNVTKLENKVTMTDAASSFDAQYGLTDSSGNVVAVSADGNKYSVLETATAEEDLNSTTGVLNDGSSDLEINFGTNTTVTSGTVTSSLTDNGSDASDTLAFSATEGQLSFTNENKLASGDYTVVDNTHALVSSGQGLVNSDGDLVATGDGDTFSNLNGNELFNIASGSDTLGAGDTITIASSGGIDVSTQTAADDALTVLDDAISSVSAERSKLGAYQNRLEHTINNLGTSSENLTAAESRIRDVDMAKEMMNQTKSSILSQASQAMLAKANQMPQGVLQLLR
ncbi:flagellin [Halobacillus halophilus]|uniref:flagellin N-terminal helical domain-containing protein n=1 Tax=Halobacillus halophilus TaxID=1570 RepID=UPI00296F31A1|nr:flagellin [Halobacillus halophilus]